MHIGVAAVLDQAARPADPAGRVGGRLRCAQERRREVQGEGRLADPVRADEQDRVGDPATEHPVDRRESGRLAPRPGTLHGDRAQVGSAVTVLRVVRRLGAGASWSAAPAVSAGAAVALADGLRVALGLAAVADPAAVVGEAASSPVPLAAVAVLRVDARGLAAARAFGAGASAVASDAMSDPDAMPAAGAVASADVARGVRGALAVLVEPRAGTRGRRGVRGTGQRFDRGRRWRHRRGCRLCRHLSPKHRLELRRDVTPRLVRAAAARRGRRRVPRRGSIATALVVAIVAWRTVLLDLAPPAHVGIAVEPAGATATAVALTADGRLVRGATATDPAATATALGVRRCSAMRYSGSRARRSPRPRAERGPGRCVRRAPSVSRAASPRPTRMGSSGDRVVRAPGLRRLPRHSWPLRSMVIIS